MGMIQGLHALTVWAIRGYQRMISRHLPPMCRFSPSCSQYGVRSLQRHGLFRGGILVAWRVLRCNPFHVGGHDPVPADWKEPLMCGGRHATGGSNGQ
jgi:putative membrane protein insertion efficiency factor